MSESTDDNRLGEYLRARRGLVSPQSVGLPSGENRRVSGLRREEIAMLAGISVDYYLRLERGRDSHPSAQVLDALARVLQLDDVEAAYLYGLVRDKPRAKRGLSPQRVPPRLHELIASIGLPAFIESRTFEVLAANTLATALSPRLRVGENRLRSLMLDPEEQAFHHDWPSATAAFVASFRDSVGSDSDDPRAVELVGELSIASGRFRELWARQDVRTLRGGSARMHHPLVGELHLHRDKLPVDEVLLVVYYADVGSESADKLAVLASYAATASITDERG